MPPKVKIWWSYKPVTSNGETLPGENWKGFSIIPRHSKGKSPFVLLNCAECAVFRWRRTNRSPNPCNCLRGRPSYWQLDAADLKNSDFKKFRYDIGYRLRAGEQHFRKYFLDVLGCYPSVAHNKFCLRISIVVKRKEVKVKSVKIGRWGQKYQEANPWWKEANQWDKKAREKHKAYVGVGIVIVGFDVYCSNRRVRFEVQMGLPLSSSELPPKVRWDPRDPLPSIPPRYPDLIWACDLVDPLCDHKPQTLNFDTQI